MNEDREYLKQLERTLLKQEDGNNNNEVFKTVNNANQYLQDRELFWMNFD